MRSNNAVALLPFNMFEFTLLAEVVAVEADLELGPFRLEGMSMHLYEAEVERAREILAAPPGETEMPPIEPGSKPLDQLNQVSQLEAALRHEQAALAQESTREALDRGKSLDPYWRPFFNVLLVHALERAGQLGIAYEVVAELPNYFSKRLETELDQRAAAAGMTAKDRLFPSPRPGAGIADAVSRRSVDTQHLDTLLNEIETSEGIRLDQRQMEQVRQALEEEPLDLAARSSRGGEAGDHEAIDRTQVLTVIRRLRLDR
jgi:hypothetical protein